MQSVNPHTRTPFLPAALLRKTLAAGAVLLALALNAGAADHNPPERMTYQGFLVDGNGMALGFTAPKNYDVIFRIWKDASSTTASDRLWTEQQTVTVNKGYFSVLLGEGADHQSEARPPLSSVISGADASDRFVGITVKGIGSGGADADILPRLRLLTSPYAFMARNAANLVSPNGSNLVMTANGALSVNGTITGNGSGLTALNAANVASGTLATARIPGLAASKISAGTLSVDRIPNLNASKITAGILSSSRIPSLNGSHISDGALTASHFANSVGVFAKSGANISYTAGKVGIGTINPSSRLEVGGFSNPQDTHIQVSTSGGNNYRSGLRLRHYSGDWGWTIESDERQASYGLYFINHSGSGNSVTSMMIDRNNNRLDVLGDIRSGEKDVPVGEERLRIVRGLVDESGNRVSGGGFTVSWVSEGTYRVVFTPAFGDLPAVTVTPMGGNSHSAVSNGIQMGSTEIITYVQSGARQREYFSFIAIGAR